MTTYSEKKMDLDAFISGSQNDTRAKKARKRTSTENLLLIATGRYSDRGSKKPFLLHLDSDINFDINKYCSGNNTAIINYLIRRGLDELIKEGKLIVIESE